MDKKSTLARFAQSRSDLLQAIDDLSTAHITGPQVEGIWTIKDLLGHLSSWEETLLIPLRSYAQGGPFHPEHIPDHDTWNAAQASRKRDMSVQAAKDEMGTIRHEILVTVDKLTDQQLEQVLPAPWGGQETIVQMLDGLAWHEEEHLKSILHWKESKY